MNHNSYRKTAELLLFIVIAAIYFHALTYRAFGFFFDRDDIHNLSWGHIIPYSEFIRDTFNVATMATIHTYRPVGALFYKFCYHTFGLDFPSFHLARTGLHLFNATLVFLLIRSFVKDTMPSFFAALLFTFHVAALDAYWRFSSIFDILCATFMFLTFLFYIQAKKLLSVWMFGSIFFFFLACRTKEMAFMLPIIFLFYEVYKAKEDQQKIITIQNFKKLLPFFLLALVMGIPKAYAGFSVERENPYALELSAFLDGIKFYSNQLFRTPYNSMSGAWVAISLGLLALLSRNRLMQFAFAYVLISIMPVILLINHRHGFYGYIPLFGVSLYAAAVILAIKTFFSRKPVVQVGLYALICAFFVFYSMRNMDEKKSLEESYLRAGNNIEVFINLLMPLNPKNDSQFLFDSVPENFDNVVLTSSLHLLFHDWTLTAERTPDCEKLQGPLRNSEVYCISYDRQRVYRIKL